MLKNNQFVICHAGIPASYLTSLMRGPQAGICKTIPEIFQGGSTGANKQFAHIRENFSRASGVEGITLICYKDMSDDFVDCVKTFAAGVSLPLNQVRCVDELITPANLIITCGSAQYWPAFEKVRDRFKRSLHVNLPDSYNTYLRNEPFAIDLVHRVFELYRIERLFLLSHVGIGEHDEQLTRAQSVCDLVKKKTKQKFSGSFGYATVPEGFCFEPTRKKAPAPQVLQPVAV